MKLVLYVKKIRDVGMTCKRTELGQKRIFDGTGRDVDSEIEQPE